MRKLGKKMQDRNDTLQAYATCICSVCTCASCANSAVYSLLYGGGQSQSNGNIYLLWN